MDTLCGPYNDLDSFLFLLEAVSFIPRFFPLVFFLALFTTLVPLVPFDVSHESGLCRFPLACMGLVFSIMLSDMFCWRKRCPMCY